MSMRPKTKRRLLYLLVGALLVVGSTAWVFRYRLEVANVRIQQERPTG
ncbi:MAG: hypothetical protein M3O30_13295 [Planctomycetota bacterium]|nr:hypothetical protein [Planctomycetota bacterium]